MKTPANFRETMIGVFGFGLALIFLFIWIPLDIDTGILDIWRRSVRIGDAMLPTFAAIGLVISSLAIIARSLRQDPQIGPRKMHLHFILCSVLVFILGIGAMFVLGPLATFVFTAGETPYRLLFDTAPWKYVGFTIGGTLIASGFTALAYRDFQWRFLIIAVTATLTIAFFYDLAFNNLLLPPNGDI